MPRTLAIVNASELVTCSSNDPETWDVGVIDDGAMLVDGGRVRWTGTTREFREKGIRSDSVVDAGGKLVTPGFVDPHTHLAFAGTREDELERKTKGETYGDILKSGGGILRTIRETTKAGVDGIVRESKERLWQLLANGVTTVEVKSGYGGDLKGELMMLDAIGKLRALGGPEVVSTFMGLHATPEKFSGAGDYARYVIREVVPRVSGGKNRPMFSDCFCEEGVFTPAQCEAYLRASKRAGLRLKVHADEFSDSGGAALAAKMKCTSADHLGRSSAEGLKLLSENGVSAVVLPGTSLYSGITYADARRMSGLGCHVALGTDLSPNSWVESPQLVMGLACSALKMSPAEALGGFTVEAARALGRDDIGRLDVGCRADFVVHNVEGYRFIPYRVGGRYVERVYREGIEIWRASGGLS